VSNHLRKLTGLVLAFGGFEITGRVTDALDLPSDGLWPHVTKWLPTLSLLGFVRVVEDEPLSSIGWRPIEPRRFVRETAIGLAVMLGANVVVQPVLRRFVDSAGIEAGLGSFADLSIPERLFVAVTAGTTEEIAFRGYAVERLATLTGNASFGGLISLVAFVLGHASETWDRSALVHITQPTAVLTVIYLRVRSLPVVVAVHALNDAIGLLLADRYAADDPETNDAAQ